MALPHMPPLHPADPWMLTADAAPFMTAHGYPISAKTLTRWRCEKQGPSYYKAGRHPVYKASELIAWIEAKRVHVPLSPSVGG
jgi:hypothetical protein